MMSSDVGSDAKIRQITIFGAVLNFLLSVVKVIAGLLFGSMSVVVDGLHSLSDLVTDAAVLIGVQLSRREPDEKHPYGHEWYETFTTVVISILLIITGVLSIYKSASGSTEICGSGCFAGLILASLLSIVLKELLYRKTCVVAKVTNCSSLYANAWHHRSDAMSSFAVLAGLVAQMLGFEYGDRCAAVIVGALIIAAAMKLLAGTMRDFTNAAVDKKIIDMVEGIVKSNPAIRQMHKLRSRSVGREIFLDFHILVDSSLSVVEAHKISMDVEHQISDTMTMPVNIIVHIEPDEPCFWK
ncbi:MAG: cation diffusion facilitator family transporter [Sedimentisphaeraceae bacterium JB056]